MMSANSIPTSTPPPQPGMLNGGRQPEPPALDDDAWYHILAHLSAGDLARASLVSKRWHRLSSRDFLWLALLRQQFGESPGREEAAKEIFARCSKNTQWEPKETLNPSGKVTTFVRDSQQIIFSKKAETSDSHQLVFVDDLYNGTRVTREVKEKITEMVLYRNTLYTAGWRSEIHLWNTESKTRLEDLRNHSDWPGAISKDGKRLVTLYDDGKVKIWDMLQRITVKEMSIEGRNFYQILLHHDSAVSLSIDGRLFKTTPSDGTRDATQEMIDEEVVAIALYHNQLIVAKEDQAIKLWDPSLSSVVGSAKTDDPITAIHTAGTSLALGHSNGMISLWQLPTFEKTGKITASDSEIIQIVRTADELTVLDQQGTLKIFRLA